MHLSIIQEEKRHGIDVLNIQQAGCPEGGRSEFLSANRHADFERFAVICGADTYDAIELFGKAHHDELKKILRLPNGIPSHDTINRVFQSINARHFERLFVEWVSGL